VPERPLSLPCPVLDGEEQPQLGGAFVSIVAVIRFWKRPVSRPLLWQEAPWRAFFAAVSTRCECGLRLRLHMRDEPSIFDLDADGETVAVNVQCDIKITRMVRIGRVVEALNLTASKDNLRDCLEIARPTLK